MNQHYQHSETYSLAKRTLTLLGIVLFIFQSAKGQEDEDWLITARHHVHHLCSESLAGRGYQHEGHLKAATYIEEEFRKYGLKPIPGKENETHPYFQQYRFTLNRIDSAELKINGRSLKLGTDFIVSSRSGGKNVEAKLKDVDNGLPYEMGRINQEVLYFEEGLPEKVEKKPDLKEKYSPFKDEFMKVNVAAQANASGVIILRKKLTAGLSSVPVEIPVFEVKKEAMPKKPRHVEMRQVRRFSNITSQNVIGYVEGSKYPDKYIFLTAHYDHLGQMGDAIFWGANDNASGTAVMLTMAEYFSKPENQPEYSIVFVGFGSEEAGLIGSRYYVNTDPIFPLDKIHFLLNMDLMGNGDDGIVAVAGIDFEDEFNMLVALNDSLDAVKQVRARRNSPNSDHYFFVTEGVRAFFIYTLGGPPHYHDVMDKPSELRFSEFHDLRKLLLAFLEVLQDEPVD